MKKILSLLLAALLCFSLAACGSTYDPYGILGDDADCGTVQQEQQADSRPYEGDAVSEEVPSEVPYGESSGAESYVDCGEEYAAESRYACIRCTGYGVYSDGTPFLQLEIAVPAGSPAPVIDVVIPEMGCYINELQISFPVEVSGLLAGDTVPVELPISEQMEQLGLSYEEVSAVWLGFEIYHGETGEILDSVGFGVEFSH